MGADPRAEMARLEDELRRRGDVKQDRFSLEANVRRDPGTNAAECTGQPIDPAILEVVPADGEWHYLQATIDGDGKPVGAVRVDGTIPSSLPKREPIKLDTRQKVTITLSNVTDGPVTGWRVKCSACPGISTDRSKSNARRRAFYHQQKHFEQGHRAIIDEPNGKRTRKPDTPQRFARKGRRR